MEPLKNYYFFKQLWGRQGKIKIILSFYKLDKQSVNLRHGFKWSTVGVLQPLSFSRVTCSSFFDAGPAGSQWTWGQEEQQRQEEPPVVADKQPEEQPQQEEHGWDGTDSGGGWTDWANQNPRKGVTRLRWGPQACSSLFSSFPVPVPVQVPVPLPIKKCGEQDVYPRSKNPLFGGKQRYIFLHFLHSTL